MIYQQVETLKKAYTDKCVVVDARRPELARFKDFIGRVRTVNMNGRALVEFLDYYQNSAWVDIDVDFIKVVDEPKPVEQSAAQEGQVSKAGEKTPVTEQPGTGNSMTKAPDPDKPKNQEPAAKAESTAEKKPSPLELARAKDAEKKEKITSEEK